MTPKDLAKIEARVRAVEPWCTQVENIWAICNEDAPALIAALKLAWEENERVTTIANSAVAHLAEYEKQLKEARMTPSEAYRAGLEAAAKEAEGTPFFDDLRGDNATPPNNWNVNGDYGKARRDAAAAIRALPVPEDTRDERIKELQAKVAFLEKASVENAIRAHGWMEAHDKLKAGKPYKFPEPKDHYEAKE